MSIPIAEAARPTFPCPNRCSQRQMTCGRRGPSLVEMSVFSQECVQREQCAQPVDTNGPPHHRSCAALDRGDRSQPALPLAAPMLLTTVQRC